ncbi:MAG: hypothetical protein ACYC5V_03045 [Gemmatimonadaceae bacterium]
MFTREEMRRSVAEFLPVYANRPVLDNAGGMGLNHSWATWFILRALRPPVVVESGVYRGHSTWLIEQAVPDAVVYAFDPDLAQRDYVSPRARYSDRDFTQFDWSAVDTREAVCFFDDHQNAYQRLIHLAWLGFRRAIFEDNWPVGEGDCYSLRHLMAGTGATSIQMSSGYAGGAWNRWRRKRLERRLDWLGHRQEVLVPPNAVDRANLERRVRAYVEMPPVKVPERSPWNTSWSGNYACPEPLLPDSSFERMDLSYGFLAYVELRDAAADA